METFRFSCLPREVRGADKGGRLGAWLFAPFPSAHSVCPDVFVFYNDLSPAKHCTLQEVNLRFIEHVHHLLLLQYEPGPPCSVPQQAMEARRDCSFDPPHLFVF